jgi:very-short-patch-repair endonuclease
LGNPAFTRSEAERRLLALIRAAGLPPPRTNVHVGPYEVDFLWPAHRLVVEVDGFAFHSSRAAFERDRRRDADLQARGLRVTRVTWRQLEREPHAVVARLAAALALRAA